MNNLQNSMMDKVYGHVNPKPPPQFHPRFTNSETGNCMLQQSCMETMGCRDITMEVKQNLIKWGLL
jgi:hypothetical protein